MRSIFRVGGLLPAFGGVAAYPPNPRAANFTACSRTSLGQGFTIFMNRSPSPANNARAASSKPGKSPAMADKNRYAASRACRTRSLP